MTPEAPDTEWPDDGVLLLDASCLLNLYATGRMIEIVAALPWQVAVVDYVLEHEALYVRAIGANDEQDETVPVDFSPLIDDGLLLVVRLENPDEEASFVGLAAVIDDGEAMTGAIALNRGYSVAIDDRKARRVLGDKAPGMRLVSTLELVQHWATAVTIEEVTLVMQAMQHGAHYIPGQRDHLYDWWRAMMEGPKADDP